MGERVLTSITRFLETKLRLKVNQDKSAVGRPWKRTFWGYSMTSRKAPPLKPAEDAVRRLKNRLKSTIRRGGARTQPKPNGEAADPAPARLDAILPARTSERGIQAPRRMDPAQAALPSLVAMEAPLGPCQEPDEARPTGAAGMEVRHKRTGALVERRGRSHERSLRQAFV